MRAPSSWSERCSSRRRVEPVAEPGDDPADDELGETVGLREGESQGRTGSRSRARARQRRTDHELEDGAEREDEHAEHDALPAPEAVAAEEGEHGARRTAELVDGDGEAAQGRVGREGGKPALERPTGQEAAEDALVVAEEEHACERRRGVCEGRSVRESEREEERGERTHPNRSRL